eukprot:6894972-Heterocapsa_arctica.AAC.1
MSQSMPAHRRAPRPIPSSADQSIGPTTAPPWGSCPTRGPTVVSRNSAAPWASFGEPNSTACVANARPAG